MSFYFSVIHRYNLDILPILKVPEGKEYIEIQDLLT